MSEFEAVQLDSMATIFRCATHGRSPTLRDLIWYRYMGECFLSDGPEYPPMPAELGPQTTPRGN